MLDTISSTETTLGGPDWAAIEAEYRAGQKTIRRIAADHGVSHQAISKRARIFGWQREVAPGKTGRAGGDDITELLEVMRRPGTGPTVHCPKCTFGQLPRMPKEPDSPPFKPEDRVCQIENDDGETCDVTVWANEAGAIVLGFHFQRSSRVDSEYLIVTLRQAGLLAKAMQQMAASVISETQEDFQTGRE
jgi:hypothetical protein